MKLILIILSVVATISGLRINLPVQLGLCKNPPIGPEIKIAEFFNKKWYNWLEKGNVLFRRQGTCSGTDMRVDGDKIELLHFQYEQILSGYVTVFGEGNVNLTRYEGLRFPVNYVLFGGYNIELPYSVIETDYSNWAVVYFCRQMVGVKLEMSLVMTRDRNPVFISSQQLQGIQNALNSIELKIDDFSKLDNSLCGEDEPHF